MWGSVLGLAMLAALNPVRLGLALLMISRPRPGPNLFAYWIGCLTVCIPELLIPLLLLHFTPLLGSLAHAPAASTGSAALRHIQIGVGVLGLTIAGVVLVRSLTRQRESTADMNSPFTIPRLLRRRQEGSPTNTSGFRRVLHRIHDAWDSGALWVAWVVGLVSVPIDGILIILAIIVASRATIGTQLSASLAFILVMYAVVEMILVGYLAAPARTETALRRLHNWVRTYRWQIMVTLLAVVGTSQLAEGFGSS
ncbi:GAP family protein [Mycobacteriaceae bacterium NPDC060252]